MALPILDINPQTFQEANPFLMGYQTGQNIYAKNVQNQFARPEAQQKLTQDQLNNQILNVQAQYAPQMTQADLAVKQSMPNYYNALASNSYANAGLTNNQSNLLGQTTPYLVQKAQADIYTDPVMSRAQQLAIAQGAAQNNPYLASSLGSLGLGAPQVSQPNQAQAVSGAINNGQPTSLPGMPSAGVMAPPPIANGQPAGQILPQNPYSNGNPTAQNYLMTGSMYSPLQLMQLNAMQKGMETQSTQGVKDYSDALNTAQTSADLGTQIGSLTKQFQDNYNKSTYKGPSKGGLPSSGFLSSFVPGNLTPEQLTDNASQNIAAAVAKTIAGGRVTNYEMQYINNLKPNRSMTPETAQVTSDFLQQKAVRMQEQQAFLNAAQAKGVPISTANNLWNSYNNQRPVYNFSTRQPNTQFQNSWNDYLTPQSVIAAQSGQRYVPLPNFSNKQSAMNWYNSLMPNDQAVVKQQIGGQ